MRTHTCGRLRKEHISETVTLCGWVDARRDFGGIVFVDLRDRDGITQLVFDLEELSQDQVDAASKLHLEDCIRATGSVRAREKPNANRPTGDVEVFVTELEVLSKTANPPLIPSDEANLPAEEIRLKHRYLDLRRPKMQEILRIRHRATKTARDYFDEHGFLEIETPCLTKSTPEGARDYLVPSRNFAGSWYALPQSPQLFKQILMVGGCDRYLQICRCFRDEDPRADRQAEFSQIDLEMSFVTREDVMEVMEGFVRRLWKETIGVDVPAMDRMTYREAMDRYGIDRPDRRFGLELVDVSDLAAKTEFKVFTDALAKRKGVVKAIRVPGGADKLTRKITDGYSTFVQQFGAGGVPVTKFTGAGDTGGFEAGVARFVAPIAGELKERLGCEPGDTIIFGADTQSICLKALGELRIKIARDMDLIDASTWDFLWVYDFPMFEYDEDAGRFNALHHPFTAPNPDQLEAFMAADVADRDAVEAVVSAGYDVICNGSEIGGGSIRIHQQEVQSKVFELLGITRDSARVKFGFLLDALSFGAPPHGGIAFGLDRLIMHLARTDNIREVIAFPKTMTGQDLMCDAPSGVEDAQLAELHVRSIAPGS
jgi:aspartyl-tRNA synthetase